jgi:hypothetical protein
MDSKIPKIIHQLWIGPKPRPSKLMDTWKEKHPDFQYILWNEEEIQKNLVLECADKVNSMEEINGKADIIRWEILYHYGGYFVDADSICVEPFDEQFFRLTAFAGYENEKARGDLVATGTMGFIKNHPLCKGAIEWMKKNEVSFAKTGKKAWYNVGPGLLTGLIKTGQFKDITIFPSYTFLPIHYTDLHYMGHKKVYAYQEWGSTKQSYETMNNIELPLELRRPTDDKWVSVLVSSLNTKHHYIVECLESIKSQDGYFGIELIWVNDGSNDINTKLLEKELDRFIKTTRFTTLKYKKFDTNKGIAYCLNEGLSMATNDIIIKMDSDDIMVPHRINTQLTLMFADPNCVMCGSNVKCFRKDETGQMIITYETSHPERMTWQQFVKKPCHWYMNHPTLCYKKSAVLSIGGYNNDIKIGEDFDIETKILKKYGVVYNIKESLLYYRIHEGQTTFNGKGSTPDLVKLKNDFIKNLIQT